MHEVRRVSFVDRLVRSTLSGIPVPTPGRIVLFSELRANGERLVRPAIVVEVTPIDDVPYVTLNVFTPYGCNPERDVPPLAEDPLCDRGWEWPPR